MRNIFDDQQEVSAFLIVAGFSELLQSDRVFWTNCETFDGDFHLALGCINFHGFAQGILP